MWSSIFHSIFHGTLRERDAMILIAAGGVALFAGSVSAWLGAHFGAKRAVRRAFRDKIEIPSIVTEVRYDELSRAVDAIALEVERISEAQRYVAKLLVERANVPVSTPTMTSPAMAPTVSVPAVTAPSVPRREAGVTTPH
jgi:ABC-type transport system involved in cytochrome bd biosynthesis fused ATPase/permease subunit